MLCRAAYLVQSTDSFAFLRADGDGGVVETCMLSAAMPFDSPDAALDAVEDHCGGRGAVVRIWVPEK